MASVKTNDDQPESFAILGIENLAHLEDNGPLT